MEDISNNFIYYDQAPLAQEVPEEAPLEQTLPVQAEPERPLTQFDLEHIEQTFAPDPEFGRRVTVTIRRNGDLLGPPIRIQLPPINRAYYPVTDIAGNILPDEWFSNNNTINYPTWSHSEFDIDKWQILHVPIYNKNTECPISFEPIKTNDTYCKCSECKYNFSKESIQIALNTKPNCPMCRAEWTDKTAYVNKSAIVRSKTHETIKTKKINANLNKLTSTIDDLIKDDSNQPSKPILSKTKHNKRFYYGK
jgi:hypothetical protein